MEGDRLPPEHVRLQGVLDAVGKLLEAGMPVTAALDGRCGSGKTCLASLIGSRYPCNVFHMDDFYLPREQRSGGWREKTGGNMDFSRFIGEVLGPLSRGEGGSFHIYDCMSGRYSVRDFEPSLLTVVEGTYSMAPQLGAYYDLGIFVTCSRDVQHMRLRERGGSSISAFEDIWIPMEEMYFASCGIMEKSSLIYDTGASGT